MGTVTCKAPTKSDDPEYSVFSVAMLSLYLLTVVGLVVVAATDPRDFSRLCSSPAPGGECPAGWRNDGGDCLKFMSGWDQAKTQQGYREERAEYIEFLFLLPVCLVRRETQCQCGRINSVTKTVFGVPIEKKEYPWEVRLSTSRDPGITCGGSIINRDEILTAANCTEGHSVETITVFTKADEELLGRVDGEMSHSVCSKREHADEDLAVLTLCEPLMFSKAVGPVCLPEPVQEKLARLILARLPASILSTAICNEDRDGSPLVVMGGDGRYTQIGVGCTEQGDSWFYIKYSALKNWINLSTSTTTSTPASTTTTTTTYTQASTTTSKSTSTPASNTTAEALIISGGRPDDSVGNSVEAYIPSTGQHCQLPDLPGDPRLYHTMEEMTVCGGSFISTTKYCLTLIDGTWQTTTTLLNSRFHHSSWASPSGVILLGGSYSYSYRQPRDRDTSERIQEDGTSVSGFPLEYHLESACAINLGSSVIITGGEHSHNKVSEYSESGFTRYLPELQQGRENHGCSYFDNEEGTKTLLVTGGYYNSFWSWYELSSTELLVENSAKWIYSGELPTPRYGLRGANIDQRVIITGGGNCDEDYNNYNNNNNTYYDDILEFKPSSGTWSLVDRMMVARRSHAVSVISTEKINMFC